MIIFEIDARTQLEITNHNGSVCLHHRCHNQHRIVPPLPSPFCGLHGRVAKAISLKCQLCRVPGCIVSKRGLVYGKTSDLFRCFGKPGNRVLARQTQQHRHKQCSSPRYDVSCFPNQSRSSIDAVVSEPRSDISCRNTLLASASCIPNLWALFAMNEKVIFLCLIIQRSRFESQLDLGLNFGVSLRLI